MILAVVPLVTIALGLCSYVHGHANMVWPPVWQDEYAHFALKSGEQCSAAAEVAGWGWAGTCKWFTNDTYIEVEPTLPDYMRTYKDVQGEDWTKHMPWRAPGSAYVYSPCGVAGGNPYGCPWEQEGINECPGGGFSWGPAAENFSFMNVVKTQWKIGSRVEAYFGIIANHGGGYSYRLCKVPKEGMSGLTEECFQRTPLRFSGDQQWVQYGEDKSTRVFFAANRTDIGTTPKGSQWTKNPIPACNEPEGGYYDQDATCRTGTQFEPPAPGLFGYGEVNQVSTFKFNVGDYLEIPDDLDPGEYVLSWRWDCEQTTQIWNTCSSINLVK